MADYKPPIRDIRFVLDHIIAYDDLAKVPCYEEASSDFAATILEEAGKFTTAVLHPLRRSADAEGAVLENGQVRTASGFADAYRQYVEGGWNGISADPAFGGMGLPKVLGSAMFEMITSANMAFGLCPMLNFGAVEAIAAHGCDDLKATYLEKLISGQWTGTMNLTEPQAGSDVGALRSKAERQGDGTYRISGQKIFISYGDHDMTGNIIHLVLARLPEAPAGTKGISLFLVPKFMVNGDGSLGARNDLRPVSLEHKLGIHASPTCVMSYGDNGNCVGYLLGEENKGMSCMFTMMNHARLGVGVQGLGVAELAYQQALSYASERVQGQPMAATDAKAPIIDHADVRRMLLTIKASVEAVRAICYLNAKAIDLAHTATDADARRSNQGLADLLTPLSKAYGTDVGVEAASLALQVHGGMGYIEETGVAQTFRDARIAPIYEGTNGIQALDLVGRKLGQDGGEHWKALFNRIETFVSDLAADGGDLGAIAGELSTALAALRQATEWLLTERERNMRAAAAAATPYLRLFAMTVGAYLLALGARDAVRLLAAKQGDATFLKARVVVARFFAEQLLPPVAGLVDPITKGDALLFALSADEMAA